ncbi:hypothetical protein [Pseudogemmobacter faecipullorum]|uniref:Uncharacterized protein n=1 Tax=Pseudogemmobacter faecipullorum TaxID=2755041 RepID=A0ABS8CI35_9RHOB|nr:hypothetical protein [Pseudogemmobacter faecipullorum]MCB5409051.1 hypothetical protein [Pseudogemmobacter faecipullorum]
MAVITVLLGGIFGMLAGLVSLVIGQGLLFALLIWFAAGMALPLMVVLVSFIPRRALVKLRA